jgi:hypothetical protein
VERRDVGDRVRRRLTGGRVEDLILEVHDLDGLPRGKDDAADVVAVVGLRAHLGAPDNPFIDHASEGLDTQK